MLCCSRFLVLLILTGGLWAAVQGLRVDLLPEVEVVQQTARLGDVAQVSGDQELVALAESLRVLEVSPRGIHYVDDAKVRRTLGAHMRGRPLEVTGEATVRRAQVIVSQVDMGAAAISALREVQGIPEQAILTVARTSDPMVFGRDDSQPHRLDVQPLGRRTFGQIPVRLRALRGEAEVARGMVVVNIAYSRKVVVATRELSQGHVVGLGDIELRDIEVSQLHEAEAPSVQEAIGSELRVSLKEGDILRKGSIRKPDAVTRGAAIRVRVASSRFSIVVTGIAQERGALGDTIRVKTSVSDKVINGVIVAPGVVAVAH